jgi:PadR family transcriptional regulator, regulatory protein AphA
MSLEHAILGFLGVRPRSGYELKTRCFDAEAKAFWSADQAQIYRTLERLKERGLAKATRFRQSGKPDRRIFDLTDAGRASLAAWIASPAPLPPPRDAFLMQVYFAAAGTDDAILGLLAERRAHHQTRLESLRTEAVSVASDEILPDRVAALRGAAYDGAIATERAAIDWLDDVLDAVRGGELPPRENLGTDSAQGLIGQAPA